jgi:hypothetical protein
VKVAWLTHHVPRDDDAVWLLPGGVGGAELTDAAMIRQAPSSVSISVVEPANWEQALDFDRVVITGTDLLTDEAMFRLADVSPLVWVHHQQQPSKARAELFARAKPFVTMSRAHAAVEWQWSGVLGEWCHGHIDLDIPESLERDPNSALWAARNHPQKGLLAARRWSRMMDLELTELSSAPRGEVLQAMADHFWFVFLPQAFDSCPRTLIEAEAAGCRIHTNNNAGRRDEGDFHEVMAEQAPKFWSWL